MEMFAISLCYPFTPIKEHTPRRVRDGLGKIAILDHIRRFEFLGNNSIKSFVMEKFIDGLCDKVKALASNNIILFYQRVFRLIPAFTALLLSGKLSLKCSKFLFGRLVKTRVWYGVAIGVGKKVLCANVHTTSRLWNTWQGIRYFANDKAIPATCRLFQRDLFRVSTEGTVYSDFDFTEFGNFQPIQARCLWSG